MSDERKLLSGDEAVALAALHCGVALGTGYPGTPSTEILEEFDRLGAGRAQWAPNEKVALEVGLGAAFGGALALVTMKHVGLNVAADVLFTATYTGVSGGLVIVSADDPGMASSQNEQDNRRYAAAAGAPMLEPADSQEAYDFLIEAFEISRRWRIPVILRMTTRVCHSKTVVVGRIGIADEESEISNLRFETSNLKSQIGEPSPRPSPGVPGEGERGAPGEGLGRKFERDIKGRVMIPAYARPAHVRLRQKLAEIAAWNESNPANRRTGTAPALGIIASGISYMHAREAAPGASILKLAMTHPLPMNAIRDFVKSVKRCVVIEEGDPYLVEAIRAAGIAVEGKDDMHRFGELNVGRVSAYLAGDHSPKAPPPKGKPPALCPSCPYHTVFGTLRKLDCIVAGDIGCYTLGVLPPYEAMDTCVCMGASLGVGLGLRHVLSEPEARRVVSVIGDSTFVHSGVTGLIEMVYNPPTTGHVLIVLDNGTTAMTGQQEHPATGRRLDHEPTGKLRIEELARALGVKGVFVTDAAADPEGFEKLLRERLAGNELTVIVTRRPCLLAAGQIREYEKRAAEMEAAKAGESCASCRDNGCCA